MRKMILAGVLLAAIAGGAFIYSRRPAAVPREIKVSGTVETTVTELSFTMPGRMLQRLVDEGEQVTVGQQVARLDDTDLRHELAGREAEEAAARAALDEVRAGARTEELSQAEAAVERLKAEAVRSSDEYRRSEQLFSRDILARRDLEQATAARDAAAAALREAGERLRQLRNGARRETVRQTEARLRGAEAGVALVRKHLNDSILRSPVAGIVLAKSSEPGEQVAAGTPVVTVGRLDRVWIRGYVAEGDLPRIRVGQKARVMVDGPGNRSCEGVLEFISPEAEFTPKNVQTEKERVRLVYRVKIAVTNPAQLLKPGMPVDAFLAAVP